MALFNRKSKEEKKVVEVVSAQSDGSKAVTKNTSRTDLAGVLKNPRITEKATMHSGSNAYTFDVAPFATKPMIAQAVRVVYNVVPRMVRVVTIPSKKRRNARTGIVGIKSGGKKAYVYLKKGETITIT